MTNSHAKYLVLMGVFFTSLSSIIIRLSSAPSLVISSYRMLITVLLLIIPMLSKHKGELTKITKKDYFLCIISGIFLALHFAFWIASINMTTIASSTVLVSCSPIFVAIASYFLFKEKLSKRAIFSIGLAFCGTILIALEGKSTAMESAAKGNAMAFLGGIFVAGYFILGNIVRKRVNAIPYVFIVYSVSTIVLFILCFTTNTKIYPYSIKEFILFFALALFCSILGHTIYNWMTQYVSATFISSSTLCEPVFASIIALILFNEVPSTNTLIGGIIILVGIFLFTSEKKKKKKKNARNIE